jgi:prophage regulatory protein
MSLKSTARTEGRRWQKSPAFLSAHALLTSRGCERVGHVLHAPVPQHRATSRGLLMFKLHNNVSSAPPSVAPTQVPSHLKTALRGKQATQTPASVRPGSTGKRGAAEFLAHAHPAKQDSPSRMGDVTPPPQRTLVVPGEAGCLPASGFMRQKQVLVLVPFSKSTLWRRIQDGSFPKPVKLSPRVTVWRTSDILHWIERYSSGSK